MFTRGNPDLFLHQIASINFFRDCMLDLNPAVHFEEIKMTIVIDQEFDCAGVLIPDGLRQLDRSVPHFFAQGIAHERGWTFLDYFLIAPLD